MAGERRRERRPSSWPSARWQRLPVGTPGWLRAQDIQFVADQRDEDGYEFTSPVTQASLQ